MVHLNRSSLIVLAVATLFNAIAEWEFTPPPKKSADLNGVTPISRSGKKTSEMRMSHVTIARFLWLNKPLSMFLHERER